MIQLRVTDDVCLRIFQQDIDLINKLPFNLDVATRMWECCESFDEGEVDCSHIHLIGGYKGIISAGDSRNVTLFYPNLYVYNRVGECLVGVWYREPNGKVKELRTKIKFDTTLSPRHIAPAISAYYEGETVRVRKCVYIDEDPLDKCKPVDCSRKYNGQRLFYSTVERRCLAAPKCNKKSSVNKKHNSNQGKMDLPAYEYDFIVCHHGNKSHYTGHCRCHEGWYSYTSHIRPTTLKVHLCTDPQYEPRSTLEDTLTEISESVHHIVPRFVEALCKPNLYKIQAIICGSALLIMILFSITFTLAYKGKKKVQESIMSKIVREKKEEKPVEMNEVKESELAETTNQEKPGYVSTPEEQDTLLGSPTYYTEIRNPQIFYNNQQTKMLDYIPNIVRNPSNSIGFSTRTMPALQFGGYTTSSMTPHEKLNYFRNIQEDLPMSEISPLLRNGRQDINRLRTGVKSSIKTPRSGIKAKEYSSSVRKKTASSLTQKNFLPSRKQNSPAVLPPKRRKVPSSVSRSLARLTYSSLPSSDSLLTLADSSETPSPCSSSDEKSNLL